MTTLKTFNELRKINVNEMIEKKGGLSYLSWANAVDVLLQHDPSATWNFHDPKSFGQTMMVSCSVTAFGKTMIMHLPVMDNRNNAIANPDARKVSDAMMRCLAKCIACFGIGLYIYAGEDLPDEDPPTQKNYRIDIGKKYLGKALHEVPHDELKQSINYFERQERETGIPTSGKAKIFVELATEFLNQGE